MKNVCLSVTALMLLLPSLCFSADHWLSGRISNITTISRGTLIMLSSGVPDNCSSSPSGWMLVKKENTTIASLVLTMWSMDKREATVYTKPATDTSYCEVTQVDPTR